MRYRRMFRSVLVLAGLGVFATLLPAPGASRQEDNVGALERGTLEVWVPQTVVMGRMDDPTARVITTYQWQTLLDDFSRDFPGFDLRFRLLARDDFEKALHSSEKNTVYPDVAFLDNQRERGPLVERDAGDPDVGPLALCLQRLVDNFSGNEKS